MSDTNFIESSTPMVNSVLHATKILDYYASQRREYLSPVSYTHLTLPTIWHV